ncbi:MAG: LuxR C-terminal-related transcriptional regulator, partial [Solirubrobacteraceae bacterium]
LLDDAGRRALVLAATSGSGDLSMLERAAGALGIDLAALAGAERAGLVTLAAGVLEFRHPLVRSAVYANARAEQRREAHRALAGALPDRDVDRRAWHLAAAALGADDIAAAALEQAAVLGRDRSAYAVAAAGFERAARLVADAERRARLLFAAAESAWLAGSPDRAVELLAEGRPWTEATEMLVRYDQLAGHVATKRGPVMRGHEILTSAAARADPDRAVAMLADAVSACFYAGEPAEMLRLADRVAAVLSADAAPRARFLGACAVGIAHVIGGDAAAGAVALREAVALAESRPDIGQDVSLLPWLVVAPIFLRDGTGRRLFEHALGDARDRGAVGVLPLVLCMIARDQATTDRWALAEATYREALGLSRETGQRTVLAFALAGLAALLARRGRDEECRAVSAEALELCERVGVRLHEVWVAAALGELELGLGDLSGAAARFEHQQRLLEELGIIDADLSPAADLVDVYIRLGRDGDAREVAHRLEAAAEAKGQPWSLARAHRCQGLLAGDDELTAPFQRALSDHALTLDAFETARTRLAFGERLRRARNRILAREQLRAALETFELLDARPWADRARGELSATGETLRRRTPSTIDELTPQELQIGLLLAGGKTTREAAATLFLSPKTIEYHLRHVYLKLDIHSREELARALAARPAETAPDMTTS